MQINGVKVYWASHPLSSKVGEGQASRIYLMPLVNILVLLLSCPLHIYSVQHVSDQTLAQLQQNHFKRLLVEFSLFDGTFLCLDL